MNLPSGLSAETCAWMRVQMTIAAARAVELVRAEITRVDDFSNGLFVVLAQVLPQILRDQPALAARLAPHWCDIAERFNAAEQGRLKLDAGETLDLLEARKLLYEVGVDMSLWPVGKLPCAGNAA